MKVRKKTISFLIVLIVALLFLGGVAYWWFWAIQPIREVSPSSQTFVIKKGEDLTSIAARLQREDLIRSSLAFKILILAEGLAGQVQAGDFRLKSSLTIKEVAYVLTHGTLDVWLTFPEGWRREESSRRLTANLESFDYQEFLNLTKTKEGFLFPDTYLIPKDASPSAVFGIFSRNFEKKYHSDLIAAAQKAGLTQNQVVILASIVEREAGRDKDRPLIADILLKRWRQNWPLQADATVQYFLGSQRCGTGIGQCDFWKPVKKTDLKIDSPYNTYLHKGLPPAPICNPGLASLEAVVNPEESDYWFYLSDPTGVVHYAITNEEHNENVQKYLR